MKVKKAQAPRQNKPKNKLIFFLFEIFQNLQFLFSNLHERSGIGLIKRKTKFPIFIFRVMIIFVLKMTP